MKFETNLVVHNISLHKCHTILVLWRLFFFQTPKNNKGQKNDDTNKNSLIAMGTLAGTIILYSPEKREVIATLEHGSPNAVLDIAWGGPRRLFSIGDDNIVVEWDIVTGKKIL